MTKETITYTDLNGNERTETHYFALNRTELVDLEMTLEGGLQQTIQRIIDTDNRQQLYFLFKDIVLRSYGIKDPDGRGFDKTEEIRHKFEISVACDVFIMSLLNDTDKAIKFINGVVPQDAANKVKEENTNIVSIQGATN